LFTTDRIRLSNLFLPYLEHHWAIYSELAHPSAPSCPKVEVHHRPVGPHSRRSPSHPASPSHASSLSRPRLQFHPWWVRIDVLYHLVFFFRELMLCITR
jgi:hypothetical protein